MITLKFKNHIINMHKCGEYYELSPHFLRQLDPDKFEHMGDIVIDKSELSELIVKLNELLHGK